MDTTGTDRTATLTDPPLPPAPPGRGAPIALLTVIGGLALAGILHVVAAGAQSAGSPVVIVFFLLVASAQVAAAAWLSVLLGTARRPQAWQAAALLGATVALVCLHLVVHSSDLLAGLLPAPGAEAGPAHDHGAAVAGPVSLGEQPVGTVAPPGLLGTAAVAAELAAAAGLLALLPRVARRRATDGLLVLGVAAWVLWWTGVLA